MPSYGGFIPSPERYGGAKPRVQIIIDALNSARGTAYDVTGQSPVWVENMALARAIADVFDTNELLANQFDPRRMSSLLSRWEKIYGITLLPGATAHDRRAAIALHVSRTGIETTYQQVYDRIAAIFGAITFSIVVGSTVGGDYLNSWAGNWYVQPTSSTSTAVTLFGQPADNYQIRISVTSTGGLGAGQFQWSSDGGVTYSANTPLGSSVALGSTGLTVSFAASTYTAGWSYVSSPVVYGGTSTLAKITVACTKPSWMSLNDFYNAVAPARALLDDFLPAWVSFQITLDGVHGAGFYLDEPNNLDNQRFL